MASMSFAQTFGRNKVTDKQFEWMTYKTMHFVIYYYPEAQSLVRTMGDMAEMSYAKVSDILNHDIKKPIPLVLYKSDKDFKQTNIILEPIEEGVGGVTELLKYRVVIPFTGSMGEFQKVITHEVAHVFQFDILYKKLLTHIYTGEFLYSPPIWFVEGISEYIAENWGIDGEMVLRDAVFTNTIVPLTKLNDWTPLGTRVYLGYKQGLSAITYLAEKYGIDKIGDILRELSTSRTKNLDDAMKSVIGVGLEQFNMEWMEYLKRKYWPDVGTKESPVSLKQNITEKDNSYNNVKPTWSPSGDLIAFIAHYDTHEDIKIVSSIDGKEFIRLSELIQRQDTIREKGTGLAWSPDGDKIAFFISRSRWEYLMVVDIVANKILKRTEMPFDSAYSPTWSPDSEKIAFIGLKDGRSDIYIFDSKVDKTERVTFDPYDENHVSWHPSEQKLIYSSERNGAYKIFLMDLISRDVQQLTFGDQNDLSPSWLPDGQRIAFSSNINGIYDVYILDIENRNTFRKTNILTGCFNPSFRDDKLLVSIFYNYKNEIYVISSKDLISEPVNFPGPSEHKEPIYVIDEGVVRGTRYSTKFTPDMIYVNFGYILGGTFDSSILFVASDMMGDHRIIVNIDALSITSQPDLFAGYYYLRRRTDFGGALFNLNEFHIEGSNRFWQRYTGVLGYLSYPINEFRRIDFQFGRYMRHRNYINIDKTEIRSLNTLGISFVHDSSIWNYFGPYFGSALNVSLEKAAKFTQKDADLTNIIVDVRKYIKLGSRSCLAVRGIYAMSMGKDKENFYLGSSFQESQGTIYFEKPLVRGYDFNELFGTQVGLVNLEIRIPFVDKLMFGWPFSWGLEGVRGVIFMDMAGVLPRPPQAKDIYGKPIVSDKPFEAWISDEQGFRLMDLKASVGVGFRIGPLSFDFAKKTDLRRFSRSYKFHFGIGQDF